MSRFGQYLRPRESSQTLSFVIVLLVFWVPSLHPGLWTKPCFHGYRIVFACSPTSSGGWLHRLVSQPILAVIGPICFFYPRVVSYQHFSLSLGFIFVCSLFQVMFLSNWFSYPNPNILHCRTRTGAKMKPNANILQGCRDIRGSLLQKEDVRQTFLEVFITTCTYYDSLLGFHSPIHPIKTHKPRRNPHSEIRWTNLAEVSIGLKMYVSFT